MKRWILIVLLVGSQAYADEQLTAYNIESVRPDLVTDDGPTYQEQEDAFQKQQAEQQKELDDYQTQLDQQAKIDAMQKQIDDLKKENAQ